MDTIHGEENEDNEFIRSFDKKFITIPRNTDFIKKNVKNDPMINQSDTDSIQNDKNINSVNDILEQSRVRVINSLSVKSLSSPIRQDDSVEKNTKLKTKEITVQKIFNNRFSQYKQKLSKSINKLESICEQNFGGLNNINSQLSKHQLSRQELVEYYAKMLSPHSDLPRILQKYKQSLSSPEKLPKIKSSSQKNIAFFNGSSQPQKKQKKQLKHNKWYIQPQKRFSISNEKTLYDWRTEEGVRNVIRTQQLRIKSKEIGNLIKEVKQKFHRQPIFCKYVKIT